MSEFSAIPRWLGAGAIALLGLGTSPAMAACQEPSWLGVAIKIANGHAWASHAPEFRTGTTIAGVAFPAPGLNNRNQFAAFVESVLEKATDYRQLPDRRQAYWHGPTGTLVLVNDSTDDCGTAFRPTTGVAYYRNL